MGKGAINEVRDMAAWEKTYYTQLKGETSPNEEKDGPIFLRIR